MQLLPAIDLLGIDHHQQLRRLPICVQILLELVGIPIVEHSQQKFADLLRIRIV
jgi:hypothetical protein